MNLAQALRLLPVPPAQFPSPISQRSPCIPGPVAFVGAGGKTTAMFTLARELPPPVLLTASTHLGIHQASLADIHHIASQPEEIFSLQIRDDAITLFTGPQEGERLRGLDEASLLRLHAFSLQHQSPLLIEADGSRLHPLKAPASHEPAIPAFAGMVVVVAGLGGLGKALNETNIHRPEIFARLSGLDREEIITPEALSRLLTHPEGGLKNIPEAARRAVLLNQADTPVLQAQARGMVSILLGAFHTVILASLAQRQVLAAWEPTAGILLAAGEAARFGQPKQVLGWMGKPLVRHVAESALQAGLSPLIVVTGAHAGAVTEALAGLPVLLSHNPDWREGQSTSIRAGLGKLPRETGAAIFLLADQPQVTPAVLRALVEQHDQQRSRIIAPLVQRQRANPVLFDRVTFPDLLVLSGDTGGRAIFSRYPPAWLPWQDENLLTDIDTPQDYQELIRGS